MLCELPSDLSMLLSPSASKRVHLSLVATYRSVAWCTCIVQLHSGTPHWRPNNKHVSPRGESQNTQRILTIVEPPMSMYIRLSLSFFQRFGVILLVVFGSVLGLHELFTAAPYDVLKNAPNCLTANVRSLWDLATAFLTKLVLDTLAGC